MSNFSLLGKGCCSIYKIFFALLKYPNFASYRGSCPNRTRHHCHASIFIWLIYDISIYNIIFEELNMDSPQYGCHVYKKFIWYLQYRYFTHKWKAIARTMLAFQIIAFFLIPVIQKLNNVQCVFCIHIKWNWYLKYSHEKKDSYPAISVGFYV